MYYGPWKWQVQSPVVAWGIPIIIQLNKKISQTEERGDRPLSMRSVEYFHLKVHVPVL